VVPDQSKDASTTSSLEATRLWIVVGLILTVSHFVPSLGVIGDSAYTFLGLAAMAVIVTGILRNRPQPAGPWWLCTASAILFSVGAVLRDAVQQTGDLGAGRSFLPDVFTLPGYVLFAIGFVWLLRARGRELDEPGVGLDASMLALASFLLVWILLLSPAISNLEYAPLSMLSVAIYPPISAFLAALAARLAFVSGQRKISHRLLLGGMAGFLVGDTLYFLVEVHRLRPTGGFLDLPYGVSYTLMGAAALHPSMREVAKPIQIRLEATGLRKERVTMVAAAMLLPALLVLVWKPATALERVGVASLALGLTAIAIVRLVVAMRHQLASEAKYAHLALHDALTDLPNRHYLLEYVARMAKESRSDDGGIGVVYLDLDQFKLVNDSLGHATGDRLLRALAQRLATLTTDGQVLARLSGDEFLIVVRGGLDEAMAVADRVKASFEEPLRVGVELYATASIGVAHVPSPFGPDTAAGLIRDADTAMYRSKAYGRNTVTVFDESMRERVARRLRLESDLRSALAASELEVHYQPIVALPSTDITGFEALVRWRTPDGWIGPVEFIPVAEESGLIVPLGAWVMREAMTRLAEWRTIPGLGHLTMSVNVSAQQIRGSDVVALCESVLTATGLPGSALWAEVTESMVMADSTENATILENLQALGVGVCVDDFGTGFSSLAYLQQFPIDRIKIDRSFVKTINDNDKNLRVVAGIAAIAHALEIDAVAEGIETLDQAVALTSVGCPKAQGYLFGRPQPPALIAEHLRRSAGALRRPNRDLSATSVRWLGGDHAPADLSTLAAAHRPVTAGRESRPGDRRRRGA
jgi:diguanylate cyclase (GGDEF)-like protein